LLFLQFEYSFDDFHNDSESINRIVFDGHTKNRPFKSLYTSPKLSEAIEAEFMDAGEVIRLYRGESALMRNGDTFLKESNFLYADKNLFGFFNLELEKGNPKTALAQPHSMVVTQEFARRYFGDNDPIGKIITIDIWVNGGSEYPFGDHKPNPSGMDPKGDYIVTGVVKNFPPNTHLQFDCLLSLSSIYWWDMWGTDLFSYNNTATYMKLSDNTNPKTFENNLNSIVDKYHRAAVEKYLEIDYNKFLKEGKSIKYSLIPLTKLHFEAEGFRTRFEKLGVYMNVYYLSVISLIALLLGCINFVNLSTARSSIRAKEIGIRKVVGSGKRHLIMQFLLESLLLTFIALLFAILLSAAFLPYFNSFLETQITLFNLVSTWVLPVMLIITIVVGYIAGIYPAYILSTLEPALIIKGFSGKGRHTLRNVLVLFQYGISILFIMGTIIIHRQLSHMHNKDLGYDTEQVLILSGSSGGLGFLVRPTAGKYWAFKEELAKISGVKGVSGSSSVFGRQGIMRTHLRTIGSVRDEASIFSAGVVEDNLFENFQMKITSEKNLDISGIGYYLTERAVKELKLSDPVGEYLIRHWPEASGEFSLDLDTIIVSGVIQDFHYNSAQNPIEPIALMVTNDWEKHGPMRSLYIKITGNDIQQIISEIEAAWKMIVPDSPFVYTFLNQDIETFYKEEQKLGKLFNLFGLLSLVISCLGILGLSSYLAMRKNKEISIRKILGASLNNIVGLLVKKHLSLILIAVLIFIPVAYILAQKWLEGYPYRISIDTLTIVYTIGTITLITMLSISWQLIKGVFINPLEAIKSE
jgi:putative ABC transport system permease protein